MRRDAPHPAIIPFKACLHCLALALFLLTGLFPLGLPGITAQAAPGLGSSLGQEATSTPAEMGAEFQKAQATLKNMTPEERVGQLFLVTFKGQSAGEDSEIYDLITNYFIGGVMLSAANDNFSGGSANVENAIQLTRQLQTARRETSRIERTDPTTGESFTPAFVPLFIGISQEGDGYPNDQILEGFTHLPNQMAIGATWSPVLSSQVGAVLGQEISTVGINLLLGPSLDVLEAPHTEAASDLGTRTFGGDPFWVSKLGQAYIEGIHDGSNGRVAVIAKHFPGHGGSDRLPEEEVATVRKSLDQLLGFELTPFINVTGQAPSTAASADGLLTAHIRYQGFQGNIRATTRPVSFDPQALNLLLELPQLAGWREQGGLMVSDNLGNRAVRGFYDLTSQTFDMPRRVALNAFLAGNDLLYVGDFSSGELDSINSAKQTLAFFAQKYREDLAFAQRVDESVLRILALKYQLYTEFLLDNVLVPSEPNAVIGQASSISFEVARKAVTLISPSQAELDDTLPDPPDEADRIVFLTDTRTGKQCSGCAEEALIEQRALEQAVLRLYGPQAGGLVTPGNLASYSLDDLQEMLDAARNTTRLENSLKRATWIVFSMLDASLREPSYIALSRFLTERPDLFQRKRVIVFAFNAPYFLDATNISKLTAYYGLYSKAPSFIDMAAYLLLQELRAEGASPVSIPGISYDLNIALFPDPAQVIEIALDLPPAEDAQTIVTPVAFPIPIFRIGDVIPVRTGVIVDQNNHPVPDGTPVEFNFSITGQPSPVRQSSATLNGIARTSYTITASGKLEIEVVSEPARSEIFSLDIPMPNPDEIIEPTTTPTATAEPTATPTLSPPVSEVEVESPPARPQVGDWIMALILAAGIAWLVYRYVSNSTAPGWGVRAGLLALIGGLAAYSYLALQLPGSEHLLAESAARGVFLATLGGTILGSVAAWSWFALEKQA